MLGVRLLLLLMPMATGGMGSGDMGGGGESGGSGMGGGGMGGGESGGGESGGSESGGGEMGSWPLTSPRRRRRSMSCGSGSAAYKRSPRDQWCCS